nr:unnamed protein product [Digitaria exilis]
MAPAMLLFFVTTSVWVASPPLTLMRVVGAGDGQRVKPCPPTSCGGVNISTPFGVLQEQAWESSCGAIGFQVRCSNNISYLAYSEQDHQFQILSIFYDNSSLLVADSHKLQALDGSVDESCRVPKNNGSARIGFPFSISPTNNILVLYNCTKAPASLEGLVETRCGTTTTFARVVGSYDDDGGNSNYSDTAADGCKPLPGDSPEDVMTIPKCCSGKEGGRVFGRSCSVRFEVYRFYKGCRGGHVASVTAGAGRWFSQRQ